MSKVIGFKWIAKSDDDCFHDESDRAFATQGDCFNDMMNHAVDKMKWNIEWEDVLERDVPPDENGMITEIQTGFSIEYKLHVYPDYIVHDSYSGKYTYTIIPIAVSDEEAYRLLAVKKWLTHEDGYDGAIGGLTDAYTVCDDGDIWRQVEEEWYSRVPSCPAEVKGDIDDMVLNMHLEIQKVANDINRKIKDMQGYANTHIIAEYDIDGERRAYTYCLGDLNDCNHYFDDESAIVATFLRVGKGNSEEDYYVQKPIAEITNMVKVALECLEGKAGK